VHNKTISEAIHLIHLYVNCLPVYEIIDGGTLLQLLWPTDAGRTLPEEFLRAFVKSYILAWTMLGVSTTLMIIFSW